MQDGHIEKAWDRAKDELFAFHLRDLAQEQLQQVIADLLCFVFRSNCRRDLRSFELGRHHGLPSRLGLEHGLSSQGEEKRMAMGDLINRLHELGMLLKDLGMFSSSK